MPSMEELNNLVDEAHVVHDSHDRGWGIDKKVPVALILVVIFQTVAVTWGAATLSTDVQHYGEKIIKIETNFEKFVERSEEKFETREAHEIDKDFERRELDQIKAEIQSLDSRLQYLEHNKK